MCSGICDHIVGVARESDGLRFIPRRELRGSLEPQVTYVCNRSGCHRFATPVDIHNCIRGKCKFWMVFSTQVGSLMTWYGVTLGVAVYEEQLFFKA